MEKMTNEQAIEILHELDGTIYETQQEALNIAINALKENQKFKELLEYKSEVLGDLDEENKKLKDIIHKIEIELEDLNSVPWQTKDVLAVALESIDNIINSYGEEKNEKEN